MYWNEAGSSEKKGRARGHEGGGFAGEELAYQ
jgi:hypothetical protein